MLLKLIFVILTVLGALYVGVKGVKSDFYPLIRWRLLLFFTGFVSMFALLRLMAPSALWFGLGGGVAFGVFWAFVMPQRLEIVRRGTKKEESE